MAMHVHVLVKYAVVQHKKWEAFTKTLASFQMIDGSESFVSSRKVNKLHH